MNVYFLHNLPIQCYTEMHYTVGRRMLRPYIDYIIIFFKDIYFFFFQFPSCSLHNTGSYIDNLFTFCGYGIQ